MTRTVFAIAAAALLLAAVSGTSQATPIAPLTGVGSADTAQVTQVWWHHHHHHCWWRHGYRHCW